MDRMMKTFVGISVLLISGCVALIPMEEQSPDLSYFDPDTVLISVVDHRIGKRPVFANVIGVAHGLFGKTSEMKVYPWYESESDKKRKTLAQALEERLIFGLNDDGWTAISAGYSDEPDQQEVLDSLSASGARKLLLIILDDWYVSVNANWGGGMNFDWGTTVKIYDSAGNLLLDQTSGTRHVIPGDGSGATRVMNLIRRVFRDRLQEILETTEVRDALLSGRSYSPGLSDGLGSSDMSSDAHKKLLELDGLGKREILTDAEFEDEKSKILMAEQNITDLID